MKKIKSDNGFTLVELVIALAMLAFIMTAVSAFMGSSVTTFRKSKADISVQNEAQAVYDKISDAIMQAKKVVIHGYESSDASLEDFKNAKNGEVISGTFTECYFVADEAQKKKLTDDGKAAKLFSEIPDGANIFVIDVSIDVSVPLDSTCSLVGEVTDALTGETVTVKKESTSPVYFNVNDTQRNKFSFYDKNMYYERVYALQTGKNDVRSSTPTSDELNKFIYTDSLKCVKSSDETAKIITGCVMRVDSENGAIELKMYFDDKNISYVTDGVVKVRNTGVLKNK